MAPMGLYTREFKVQNVVVGFARRLMSSSHCGLLSFFPTSGFIKWGLLKKKTTHLESASFLLSLSLSPSQHSSSITSLFFHSSVAQTKLACSPGLYDTLSSGCVCNLLTVAAAPRVSQVLQGSRGHIIWYHRHSGGREGLKNTNSNL